MQHEAIAAGHPHFAHVTNIAQRVSNVIRGYRFRRHPMPPDQVQWTRAIYA
ncbi:hypothetical protein FHW12_000438 [Dokdonella fugitiva]|uniref:Uncharacterized protein n=1 Tax=Dokdonella fugitiva TaxID=328517 RepID=A0A839EPK8_9GAMM|nr:hypothetical protein [Dokdonella fugitiva]